MKKVTLKVYGSLYIGNNFPKNSTGQVELRALTEGMEKKEGKQNLLSLSLDKDIELSGDIFVNDIIIPNDVSVHILCAGSIGCGYSLK